MNKVCVAVGHGKSAGGGYDPGACANGFEEFRLAAEIAKYTCESLKSRGIQAVLLNYDGKFSLNDRIKAINPGDFDFVCEIHLNAGGGTGSEVYYKSGSADGYYAADSISKSISQQLKIRNRGAKTKAGKNGDYFGIIRCVDTVSVLIETAFIDSDDVFKLSRASGREKCAVAIADGIEKFLASKGTPFRVKIKCKELNVREGPGTEHPVKSTVKKGEIFTVVSVKDGWGRLKSGRGWISLSPSLTERGAA